MPFYTFECPKCKGQKEVLQKISDDAPTCNKCTRILPRFIVTMKRVYKVNAKPASKDGSWGFGKDKKTK